MISFTQYIKESTEEKKEPVKRDYNNILKNLGVLGKKGKVDTDIMSKSIKDFLFKQGLDFHDITGGSVEIGIDKLNPGQNTIFLDQIFTNMLKKKKFVKKVLKGKLKDGGILISSDNHVVDGHHRWASAFILNPDCILKCTKIDLPLDKVIPILNDLLKSTHSKNEKKSGNYKHNIYDLIKKNKDDFENSFLDIFRKSVDGKSESKILKFLKKIYKRNDSDLHPLDYFIKNVKKLPNPEHKLPDREDMPQLKDSDVEAVKKD